MVGALIGMGDTPLQPKEDSCTRIGLDDGGRDVERALVEGVCRSVLPLRLVANTKATWDNRIALCQS